LNYQQFKTQQSQKRNLINSTLNHI